MRQDTPFGPVWLFPDSLPERAAMHGARLELMWPDLEGFSAMHTGPPKGGGWVVRAPLAALEQAGYRTDSAAEHPVKEGTVWPPIHIPIPRRIVAPWVTPEQLYHQDKRKRESDEEAIPCPEARACKTCPAAAEDDVCFPYESVVSRCSV